MSTIVTCNITCTLKTALSARDSSLNVSSFGRSFDLTGRIRATARTLACAELNNILDNKRDLQSIFYLLMAPGLSAWQWFYGFSWLLYSPMLVIWIGIGVINHNHAHRPMWKSGLLNKLTDLAGSALQGHPVYVFHIAHNANHHRYSHGPKDLARTYRFGGDHNHLLGHLLHPIQVLSVLYPFFFRHMHETRIKNRKAFHWISVQYGLVGGLWLTLLWFDPFKMFVLVLIPQLIGLHWLLGANYLQHAHANGLSDWDFARNFTGAVNWIFFNIGYHTAHHKEPLLHWSELPSLHRKISKKINPRLIETSFAGYVFRAFILSIFMPSKRSRSLMPASGP